MSKFNEELDQMKIKLEEELEKIRKLSQYESKFIKCIKSEKEIHRLAILGRWAEKHGIDALGNAHATLEQITKEYPRYGLLACQDLMDRALAALPQEMKEKK